jgi:hypothetical protein
MDLIVLAAHLIFQFPLNEMLSFDYKPTNGFLFTKEWLERISKNPVTIYTYYTSKSDFLDLKNDPVKMSFLSILPIVKAKNRFFFSIFIFH